MYNTDNEESNLDEIKTSELTSDQTTNNIEHIYISQLEEKLQMDKNDIIKNCKRIENENATYYWNPMRGGIALIVSDDGSYLGATSSINFDKHLEEYKNGRRNGNFN